MITMVTMITMIAMITVITMIAMITMVTMITVRRPVICFCFALQTQFSFLSMVRWCRSPNVLRIYLPTSKCGPTYPPQVISTCGIVLNLTYPKNLPAPSEHSENVFPTLGFGIERLNTLAQTRCLERERKAEEKTRRIDCIDVI